MKSFRKSVVALSLSVVSFLSVAQSIEIPGAESAQSHVFRAPLPFNSVSAPAPEGGNDTTYVYEKDSNEDGIGDWGIEPASPSGGECYPDYSDDGTSVTLMTPSFGITCTFEDVSATYTVQPNQNFEFEFNIQEVRGGTSGGLLMVATLAAWDWNEETHIDYSEVDLYGINPDGSMNIQTIDLGFDGKRNYTHVRVEVIDNLATLTVNGTDSVSSPYFPTSPVTIDVKAYLQRSNTVFENFVFRAHAIE